MLRSLHQFEICIAQNEPFCAISLEIYFHPGMRSLTLTIENNAIAKLLVANALTESYAYFGSLSYGCPADIWRPCGQ
jgi:hypothetical protein